MLKFLIGVGCGAALGLLIAPDAGEETRKQLLEIARNPREAAQRKVQDVKEDIAQMGANLGRRVAEKAMDNVIPEGLNKEPGQKPA